MFFFFVQLHSLRLFIFLSNVSYSRQFSFCSQTHGRHTGFHERGHSLRVHFVHFILNTRTRRVNNGQYCNAISKQTKYTGWKHVRGSPRWAWQFNSCDHRPGINISGGNTNESGVNFSLRRFHNLLHFFKNHVYYFNTKFVLCINYWKKKQIMKLNR